MHLNVRVLGEVYDMLQCLAADYNLALKGFDRIRQLVHLNLTIHGMYISSHF